MAVPQTTQAIVLRSIRHGDSTVVLKAYTRRFGPRSYLVRTGKKGARMAMLQPLNRLEVVVREDPDRDLTALREIRVEKPFTRIHADPLRSALALFIQEVLYKVLREGSCDEQLYRFLDEALQGLDSFDDIRHFPSLFLIHMAAHLGFGMEGPGEGEDRFDLLEGHFLRGDAPHGHTVGPPLSLALARLLACGDLRTQAPVLPLEQRRQLLDHLLLYFRLHVEGLGELRSPAMLQQVLS